MITVAFFEDSDADARRLIHLFDKHSQRFQAKHFPDYKNLKKNLTDFKPKVVLLDIAIDQDREAGLNAVEIIKKELPRTKIIMLTEMTEYARMAFKKGADGYIWKQEINNSLDFIEDIAHDYVLSPAVVAKLIDDIKKGDNINLTPREIQIICLSALDNSVPAIAKEIKLSKWAVEGHINNIKVKLGCNTIQGVVGRALYNGLVDLNLTNLM